MTVHALLVGIDAYRAVSPLNGCVNDIRRLAEILEARVTGTPLRLRMVIDREATYAGIAEAFRAHFADATNGDVALFAYAGHGSQEPAPKEMLVIEPDRRNETIVCVDSRVGTTPDLSDKELAALIAEVVARGAEVVCLFDCCHSGTITRETIDREDVEPEPGERRARAVKEERPIQSYLPEVQERLAAVTARGAGDPSSDDAGAAWAAATRHVVLSACQSDETAKEVAVGGKTRGAFSASFEQALAAEGPSASVRQLARTARTRVLQLAAKQHPVMYATLDEDLDRAFLGSGAGGSDRSLRLFQRAGAWEVDGGSLHGLVAPSGGRSARLAVTRPGETEPLGEVEVVEVEAARAVVRPLGSLALDSSAQYRATVSALPAPPLGVRFDGDGDAIEAARAAIAGSPLLGAAPAADGGAAVPHVVVRVVDGHYTVEAADGGTIVADAGAPGTDALDAGAAHPLLDTLEHLARWHAVLALENPSSPFAGLVDVEWVPAEPGDTTLDPTRPAVTPPERDGGVTVDYVESGGGWRPATWFLRIVNRSDRALHAALLDLTDAYRIHDALFRAASERIPAGGSAAAYDGKPIPFTISSAPVAPGATGRDWLKLIVSDTPLDSSLLVLPRLGSGGGGDRGSSRGPSSSDDLFASTRDIGDDASAAGPQWGTLTIPVVVRVPAAG
jgi:hypothetical protein